MDIGQCSMQNSTFLQIKLWSFNEDLALSKALENEIQARIQLLICKPSIVLIKRHNFVAVVNNTEYNNTGIALNNYTSTANPTNSDNAKRSYFDGGWNSQFYD